MGFPPAEVAAGLRELIAARGLAARIVEDGPRQVFHLEDVVITVEPLPAARATHALFQPRTLLVVEGSGPAAETLVASIRLKFLRVTG